MTPQQDNRLDTAAYYELIAAHCLATGQADTAEYVLALADGLCAGVDRDEGQAAA